MGRDLRGHADRDPVRAVQEEVREPGGKDGRLLEPVVEVAREVDRVLAQVLEHLRGDRGQPGLRVPVGGRAVAIDGSEVALTIHERIAHGEVLRHAHQRVVDGAVPVRVVLAEHVAHDGRALLVGTSREEALFPHGVEDPAVHGLESVPGVGQGALDDHAHRVVDERVPHLLLEEAGYDPLVPGRCSYHVSSLGLGASVHVRSTCGASRRGTRETSSPPRSPGCSWPTGPPRSSARRSNGSVHPRRHRLY